MDRIVRGMPAEEYHAHPALSRGGIAKLLVTPAHYRHSIEAKEELPTSDALRLGAAFHLLLLEPKQFPERVAIGPDVARNTTVWKDFAKDFPRHLLIKNEEYQKLLEMANAILAHPAAKEVLTGNGMIEASMFWTDLETGVECRARADWLRHDGLMVDVKSCVSAAPEAFARAVHDKNYHVQDAHYRDGFSTIMKSESPGFVFIAVEKTPPYAVAVYVLEPEFLAIGSARRRRGLDLYAQCKAADHWPAYPQTITPLAAPRWVKIGD